MTTQAKVATVDYHATLQEDLVVRGVCRTPTVVYTEHHSARGLLITLFANPSSYEIRPYYRNDGQSDMDC